MPTRHLRLTFPESQVTEPVIYHLVIDHDVVPNIRRAKIENHFGWMVVEVTGTAAALTAAVQYLESLDIQVASAEGDVVAG